MPRNTLTKWFQQPRLLHPQPHTSCYHPRRYSADFPSVHTSTSLSPSPVPIISHSTLRARPDPFTLFSSELAFLRTSLLDLLRSGHPALTDIAEYYFLHPSKQIRPLLILLFSQATNGLGSQWSQKLWESTQEREGGRWEELDRPLNRPDVLHDWNPLNKWTGDLVKEFKLETKWEGRRATTEPTIPPHAMRPQKLHAPPFILPVQLRFAQIIEMIHTASLLHDDVVDTSALRRGRPSAPSAFGKKLSVLGGTFIVGRAAAALARLGDREVTELATSILPNLVDGEILQLKKVNENEAKGSGYGNTREDVWNMYLQKTYLKTASMMAKGARAAVMLGGCKKGEIVREIAYAYGRNLGMAFQLVDDVLDYEFASVTLGKPGGADLQLGLATGPALHAWEEHPEMGELIQRKFSEEGDVERARDYISRSSGVQRTRILAQQYADKAKEVVQSLPDSEAKAALEVLAERMVSRSS